MASRIIGRALPVVKYPSSILRTKASPVESINSQDIQQLVYDLLLTIEKHYEVAINPVIRRSSEQKVLGPEACLSLPDMAFLVRRPSTVDVEYTNEEGNQVRAKIFGLPGVVFQHELDHLDGVLALDRDVASLARDDPAREQASRRYAQDMRRHYGQGPKQDYDAVMSGGGGGVDGRDMIRRFAEDMGEDPGKLGRRAAGAGSMGSWPMQGQGEGQGQGFGRY